MTALSHPPERAPAPPESPNGERRFLIRNVDWAFYRMLRTALDERNVRVRITYDRGNLELMAPLSRHDILSRTFNRLIEILCEELGVPFASVGSTTFGREDMDRGLEPDECYYLRTGPIVAGRLDIDPETDPPPDLAVEIDITRSSLSRLGIYASLGVPEVWRYDDQTLTVYHLQPDQTYAARDRSRHFPILPPDEVVRFIQRRAGEGDLDWTRAFRAWVRETILPLRPDPDGGKG